MADNNNFLDIISDDITGHLVQYLTVPQLTVFKQLCKQFNFIGSQAVFLQSLYNRLYQLDKTLSPALTSANAPLEFKQAFEKIRDRQNAEIDFFLEIHFNPNHPLTFHPEKLKLLSSMLNACDIELLEKSEMFLNKLNENIIKVSIAAQGGHRLNLPSCLTRFFIPEEHVEYFKNLTGLFCQGNLFTSINLNNHPKLEVLDCTNNPFLKEIHLLGCSKALDLKCDHSEQPKNIFSDNYDLSSTRLYDLFMGGAYTVFNPAVGGMLIFQELSKIQKELSRSYNAPLPPQIYIEDASTQDQKGKFDYIEEVRLFDKLKKEVLHGKKAEIIQKLGDSYNVSNCLKYGCIYDAGMVVCNQTSSMFEKTSNFFFSFMRTEKKEDALNTKRERDKSDDEENDEHIRKKRRIGSSSSSQSQSE